MHPIFFFGSGADTDCCKRLKSGQSFANALLTGKHFSESVKLNGDNFKSFNLIYPTSTKVFLQTIVEHIDEARKVIDNDAIKLCLDYINDKKKVPYPRIQELCRGWYSNVVHGSGADGIKSFFLNNAVFFDSLDEKFNSLRLSNLNDNAKRVINAYSQIYILMLKSLYDLNDEFPWTYEAVFDQLTHPYDIEVDEGSYYHELSKSNIVSKIVTTNYTRLAKMYSNREVTYLHGKLTWFEDLKRLSVFDCEKPEELEQLKETNTIMPFILIPSGVKPLICKKQIIEFSKFVEDLDNSDLLVVVGYRFNSEDNHVNSIIGEWLQKDNNVLIYFNYKKCIDFSRISWTSGFSVTSLDYSSGEKLKCINEGKILNLIIDENCGRNAFRDLLSYI